jgi:hypothetical protein
MSIREWSLGRVVVVSVLWALGVLLLMGWRGADAFRAVPQNGGVLGVSADIPGLLGLAALVLIPPIVLVVSWLVQRR